MKINFLVFLICFVSLSCNQSVEKENKSQKKEIPTTADVKPSSNDLVSNEANDTTSSIELAAIQSGLIDIKIIDSTIQVDLKYASVNNFIGENVYGNFNKCYLLPEAAERLKKAQALLKSKYPYYSIIVFDAARPKSVQYKMWSMLDIPHFEKLKYVSNPESGSLHNYGAAVDISIVDENGYELDMGTPYDYFGEMAYPKAEEQLMKEGKLLFKHVQNRLILRDIMEKSGYMPITTEWWHFNFCTKKEAAEKYVCLE